MISNGLKNGPKKVVILGSTGSIGRQTLEVIADYPQAFAVVGLAAHDEIEAILQQALRFACPRVVLADGAQYQGLKDRAPAGITVGAGMDAICELAALADADLVVSAIGGAAGMLPAVAALESGHPLALANKETLVAAGEPVMKLARERKLTIFPVDSEHSAVFQCLKGEDRAVKKIWLTASGGPFLGRSRQELDSVTPVMALKHPSWRMGPKITIDSATLINKGLEIIEAHHLFNLSYDYIDAVISPGSLIHALVEMVDGAFLAHLGPPDMRIPIQYALTYPERWPTSVQPLDLTRMGNISFIKPDTEAFPALALAVKAGKQGGTLPAVMNAANEVAVAYFLAGKIGFNAIPELIAQVMDKHECRGEPTLEVILQADEWARVTSHSLVERVKS